MVCVKSTVRKYYQAEIRCLTYFQPVLLLALRLYSGWGFFKAGLGKLQHLGKRTSRPVMTSDV